MREAANGHLARAEQILGGERGEAYFLGKLGSAFTSSICAVCRLECAAMKSIHW
ncbi:hypothetical protein ATI61_11835 [Archangium gephyra]|uniref:Uncharacterized protein n=1 Tax=Archangium gephyra TaxID=48 RepID=A0ABX9JMZ3_9BACT|nr:hypothetical protein ATI61_11835 [Archangium gephyra]